MQLLPNLCMNCPDCIANVTKIREWAEQISPSDIGHTNE